MKQEINPNLDTIDWNRISELFQLVDWDNRSPQDVENSFRKSSWTYFVRHDDEIIAFGRTVDDGKYYALLVDIVVHPDYQSRGIGKKMVTELKDRLVGYNFITLTAAPNKEGFYEKIGWKKQKSAYIFPRNERQEEKHCE